MGTVIIISMITPFSVILPFGLGGFLCIFGTAYIMGTVVIISMITIGGYLEGSTEGLRGIMQSEIKYGTAKFEKFGYTYMNSIINQNSQIKGVH